MTNEENKTKADLFGDSASAKPLFGEEAALPQGKPLFDGEFSDPGDAAFVKPLFDTDQDDDRTTLEDFQEFDNIQEMDVDTEPVEEIPVPEEPQPVEEIPVPETFETEAVSPEDELVQPANPFEEAPAAVSNTPEQILSEPVPAVETPAYMEFENNQQEQLPEPSFTIPAKKVSLSGDLESMSLGALMAYARETVNLSPEDICSGTKINEKYLLAIENDQFDKLPSGAFPGAYVRSLCSFYHLDSNACEIAQKKAAAYCTACRPPDEVYNRMNEHAIINKEEQEKFRRIVTIACIVLLLIILSVVGIVIFCTGDDKGTAPVIPSPVKMENLEKLDPETPQIPPSELAVPK